MLATFLYNTAAAAALRFTKLDVMAQDSSPIMQAFKGGFVYYLSEEGIKFILNPASSNFTRMNAYVLADDVAYNTIALFGIQTLNVGSMINDIIPDIGNYDANLILTNGAIFTLMNFGRQLLPPAVTHLPSYVLTMGATNGGRAPSL